MTETKKIAQTRPFTNKIGKLNRRKFLKTSVCAAAGLFVPDILFASTKKFQPLSFYHTHTGERMELLYTPGSYAGSVQRALEYFLRDFRTGDVHSIDPTLLDTLCAIQNCCGKHSAYEIISGYRSPKTNEYLRKHSSGVARKSLHMQGRAIDIRLAGLPTSMLRDLAINIHDGGVGYYPKSNFVHIDTGRKRAW